MFTRWSKSRRTVRTFAALAAGIVLIVLGEASGRADVNLDGKPDLLWLNTTSGEVSSWLLNGATVLGAQPLSWRCDPVCSRDWKPVGTLGDSRIVWHNLTTGQVAHWVLSGATVVRSEMLSWSCGPACSRDWKAVGTGRFRLDGSPGGVLWHNVTSGELSVWMLSGSTVTEARQILGGSCDAASGCSRDWRVVGVNRHGSPSILWHNATTGTLVYWFIGESQGLDVPAPGQFPEPYYTTVTGTGALGWSCGAASGCSRDWTVVGVEDVDYDGQDDVVWYNATTGEVSAWLLNGLAIKRTQSLDWRCDAASGCSRTWTPIGIVAGSPPPIR